jgi:hypothetical protein
LPFGKYLHEAVLLVRKRGLEPPRVAPPDP